MSAQDTRPRFFEGQYLSANDLNAVMDYVRGAQSRHALAGHTWGIALGLYLTERPALGAANRQEVILQPGFATDGFGRVLSVRQPTRLPESLFADIAYNATLDDPAQSGGPVGRLLKVWLNYTETTTQQAMPGFENCSGADSNARFQEGFEFVIGEFAESAQRDSVLIGTQSVDARLALKTFDANAKDLWDTSVPHQDFPSVGKPPRWLVPIGYVRWVAGQTGQQGYFIDRNRVAADRADQLIRAFRRYSGVVADTLEAPDGVIVLRRRGDKPDDPHRLLNLLAGSQTWAELSKDLAWVEGSLRIVEGDAKLAGGGLLFQDADGQDNGVPLHLVRVADASGHVQLRAVIGDDAVPALPADKLNGFIVGSKKANSSPEAVNPILAVLVKTTKKNKSVVGQVGVNTQDTHAALEVFGDWDGAEEGAVHVTGAGAAIRLTHGDSQAKDPSWRIQVSDDGGGALRVGYRVDNGPNPPGWNEVLRVKRDNTVGIGAENPQSPLAVRAAVQTGTDWENLISLEDSAGGDKWHLNLHVSGGSKNLNFAEVEVSGGESRLYLQAGGKVGIGTTTPAGRLTLEGQVPGHGRLTLFSATSDFEYDGGNDKLFIFKQDPAGITSFMGSNLGVGTTDPQDKLHVNGSYLRVEGAGNEQAYIGGDGVASDVQVGSRRSGIDSVVLYNTVSGRMDLKCRDINSADINCDDLVANTFNYPFIFSDEAFKQNIAPIQDALALVSQLRGVSFRWKDANLHKPDPDFGLLAQEVERVLPQLVSHGPKGSAVSYMSLIPLLLEAVKELKAEVDSLKAGQGQGTGQTPQACCAWALTKACCREACAWLSRFKKRLP